MNFRKTWQFKAVIEVLFIEKLHIHCSHLFSAKYVNLEIEKERRQIRI